MNVIEPDHPTSGERNRPRHRLVCALLGRLDIDQTDRSACQCDLVVPIRAARRSDPPSDASNELLYTPCRAIDSKLLPANCGVIMIAPLTFRTLAVRLDVAYDNLLFIALTTWGTYSISTLLAKMLNAETSGRLILAIGVFFGAGLRLASQDGREHRSSGA